MRRISNGFSCAVVALALVGGMATPANANATVVLDRGGVMRVGKNVTFCNHDGSSDVSGAGLGAPGLSGLKQAFYQITTAVTAFNDITKGAKAGASTGTLNACGRLRWIGKVGDGSAQGAACGVHKGYHGKGRIVWHSGPKRLTGDYYLHDITWKTSTGPQFEFWASGQQGAIGKGQSGTDLIEGTFLANDPNAACLTKAGQGSGKSGGATQYQLSGTFEVLNDGWNDPQNPGIGTLEAPGICKNSGNPLCAYDTKKPQTPKRDS